ncbi:Pls/PosA family non-ribosomal peptide synthetase [Cellulomonas endophytica]|uniref:Pls/PosA family non-ribosomal peptide synthetase n=1 Tax=Cellulomonas endophytica TaxID=2494735 RepID=UPI001012CD8A|nr:Pls/PosA family non-ribosomal peptide synthetase [Cellulomonas endophytica]
MDEGLRRAHRAPDARTLVDVLTATAAAHPHAPALDDGTTALSYAELELVVGAAAAGLAAEGVRRGDRVGVRIPSGTVELYAAVLAVLRAGAAYVPVDADDPDERARTVFDEAGVVRVLGADDLSLLAAAGEGTALPPHPGLDDDAWIIFTSGSTGLPKGVAVTHRSAAAFVDAEARLFLQGTPLGPGDRVLAGLSVAFDASCEEMWLAWGHGACLVPAPRALVRSGVDLGPWLVTQGVTVISTVPTLAGLWRPDELEAVRLLVFGGEACPPELAARLVAPDREVWNTYGPTEATVVACAAPLTGSGTVRIGHALDGWDLEVLAPDGTPVPPGGVGELVIGGVGLARYLDATKDAAAYAPLPQLGWERAYRSGDLVRADPEGLVFVGRADDQVKVGGRRIELGEVDAALLAVPGVAAAAAAVRTTPAGTAVLVGYLVPADGPLDLAAARAVLAGRLPAALVPLLAAVEALPTRGSGKVDRAALPWPLPGAPATAGDAPAAPLGPTAAWVAPRWTAALGTPVAGPDEDFFLAGGGSLVAAQLVAALRERWPTVTVADVYEHPRLGALADRLDELAPAAGTVTGPSATPGPVPAHVPWVQAALGLVPAALVGARWLTWALAVVALLDALGRHPAWLPAVPGALPAALVGWVLLVSPLGRMGTSVLVARTLLRGLRPGSYPRGGVVHLRLWFTEQWVRAAGAEGLSCAPWTAAYARALGARVGRDVDLHTAPPVTGLLVLGDACAVEPEVDLRGHWVDGDVLRVGRVRVDRRATVGARTTLAPGTRVGEGAEVGAGSAVLGHVPPGERWVGSPARLDGPAREHWPRTSAPRARAWVLGYGVGASVLAAVPLGAAAAGLVVLLALGGLLDPAVTDPADALRRALLAAPAAAATAFVLHALVVLAVVRPLGRATTEGYHPVRSRAGWAVWATLRLLDEARTALFPIYSSALTPAWLRALGADVGRDVEASTALLLPRMTTVGAGAFLADDTLLASYELGRGWMRIAPSVVGKRAFLGNSGMIGPGRKVPKRGLVAVLSTTPRTARKGQSFVGSPPVRLRRTAGDADATRTFAPPARLRVARALVEACRAVPVVLSAALAVAVLGVLAALAAGRGIGTALLLAGPVVLGAAAVACALATTAKWLLVGRHRVAEHPLWSARVWLDELADTFVEQLAVPWLGPAAAGSPALTWWLRSLGARIGRGTWCETYWLPEADLVELGAGATVNRGCVLQTHLFHDRVLSTGTVRLGAGAGMGPHGVVLPAAELGAGTLVGPASLVLRGDRLPPGTRWTGNPVAPDGRAAGLPVAPVAPVGAR